MIYAPLVIALYDYKLNYLNTFALSAYSQKNLSLCR